MICNSIQYHVHRVVANYLVWRLVLGLLSELPDKYQDLRNEYRRILQVTQHSVEYIHIEEVSKEGILAIGVLQVCQCVLTGCVERQGQMAKVCGTGQ